MEEKDKIKELKENLSYVKFTNLINIRNVVNVLFQNGFVKEAFELLYPFAKNKENSNMRMLFINLCLQIPVQTVLKKYETVIDDCYVQFKYKGTDEIKSVHIKKEFINEMQKSLIGHHVGDTVHVKTPACDIYRSVVIHDMPNAYAIASFSLAFIFGLYYLVLNTRIEKIQSMIDELKEHIDDKETLFNIVLSISRQVNELKDKRFSRQELEKLIENWVEGRQPEHYYEIEGMENLKELKRSIHVIGISDFTKFFIAKSLEKGFIKKEEIRKKRAVLMEYQLLLED